jgi:hypothetical protein
MMHVAHQMSIEVVHVSASLTTAVTLPWICVAVKPSVQKVESLVRENYATVLALPLTGQSGGHEGRVLLLVIQG